MFSDYSVNYIRFAPARHGSNFRKREESHFAAQKRKQSFGEINFTDMSDSQILINSLGYAEKKSKETLAGKISNALPMLFFTAIPILFGAMQKGPLSAKVKSGLSTAVMLAGIDFVFKKCDDVKDRVKNKFPKAGENSRKYPTTSSVADFAVKALAATALYVGALKGAGFLQNKFQPASEKFLQSIDRASKKLDATRVAAGVTKAGDALNSFKAKHPKIAEFMSRNSYLAPLGVVLGWGTFSGLVQSKAINDKVNIASKRADLLFELRNNTNKAEA